MLTEQFYDFMKERESIRIRRKNGLDISMWTSDPIFQTYKFTNVKRVNDWTTQKLLKDFYPTKETSLHHLLANCTIARFVGRAEAVCELGYQFDFTGGVFEANLRALVAARTARRDPIFTGAYMIPNCGRIDAKHEIVIEIVNKVYDKAQDRIDRMMPNGSFQDFVEMLCEIDGFGSFMAKEVLLDFKLACPEWQPSDWETWTPIGPGACRGAARAASDDGVLVRPLSEPKALAVCRELYEARHQLWPHKFLTEDKDSVRIYEPVPDLELCDIQFQLCEFDKYLRVKLEGRRAKTIFRPRS